MIASTALYMRDRIRNFMRSGTGSVMAMTGLLIPLIAGASLYAIDYTAVAKAKAQLQDAADTAAIAAARELHFIRNSRGDVETTLRSVATGYAQQNMQGEDVVATSATVDDNQVTISLDLTMTPPIRLVSDREMTLTAEATAEIYGAQNICIIANDLEEGVAGIELHGQSEIQAGTCGIYSNSGASRSILTMGGTYIDADFICATGGHEGSESSVSTAVTEDCPQIQDPLVGRVFPPAGGCTGGVPSIIGEDETVNLTEGTYCGGLTIHENASVWFQPGIYHFKNGPLIIRDDATVGGENVGLFFEDEDSVFEFRDSAEISFSAPETGPMAGIVVAARNICPGGTGRCEIDRDFYITSANVRSLLGTIYLTLDNLTIDSTMPVSEEAAFTILIVDNLIMRQSPALVLNTNYAATNVPVPEGMTGKPSTRIVK